MKLKLMSFPKIFSASLKRSSNNRGQTLIEFLFLFLIMISLSFIMMNRINSGVETRWRAMIKIIASPTDTDI